MPAWPGLNSRKWCMILVPIKNGGDGNLWVLSYKNTGKDPLIINNVKSSCGCTKPEWSAEPVKKGEKSAVKVGYNTRLVGSFYQAITVYSNASNPLVTLTIKGTVSPAKAKQQTDERQYIGFGCSVSAGDTVPLMVSVTSGLLAFGIYCNGLGKKDLPAGYCSQLSQQTFLLFFTGSADHSGLCIRRMILHYWWSGIFTGILEDKLKGPVAAILYGTKIMHHFLEFNPGQAGIWVPLYQAIVNNS